MNRRFEWEFDTRMLGCNVFLWLLDVAIWLGEIIIRKLRPPPPPSDEGGAEGDD